MHNKQVNTSAMKIEDIKNIFKKMIADKKAMQSYIREHGTLKGFANDTILFAKPL